MRARCQPSRAPDDLLGRARGGLLVGEQAHEFERERHRCAEGAAGRDRPVGNDVGIDHVRAGAPVLKAGVARGAPSGEQAVLREHARRGADGGRAAAVLERPAHECLHGRALGQIRRARHAAREHDKLRRRCQQLRQRAVARDGHAVRADDGVCVLNGHRVCLQAGSAEDVERDETLALLKPLGKQQIAF